MEAGAQSRASAPISLTVEEIERQQREQIPRADSVGQGQAQGADGMSQSPSTKELLNLIVAAASGDGQGTTLPAMPQVGLEERGRGGVMLTADFPILTLISNILLDADMHFALIFALAFFRSQSVENEYVHGGMKRGSELN